MSMQNLESRNHHVLFNSEEPDTKAWHLLLMFQAAENVSLYIVAVLENEVKWCLPVATYFIPKHETY